MKKFSFFCKIILLFSLNNSLIYSNSVDSVFVSSTLTILEKNAQNLVNLHTTKNYRIVKSNIIDSDSNLFFNLINNDNFIGKFELLNNDLYRIVSNDKTIYGTAIIKGKKINCFIQYKDEKYEIKPIDSVNHLILQIDQSLVYPELCNFHEDSISSQDNNIEHRVINNFSECAIRVLVGYTESSLNFFISEEDLNDEIRLAVALTNQSYLNSGVNQRIELARTCLTDYNESYQYQNAKTRYGGTVQFPLDLLRLQNGQDGYLDELIFYREMYQADIVVLIVSGYNFCGVAREILSLEDGAFCLISAEGTCLTSNFSFAHELGHLMGCRHNPEADNSNVPFSYGHGYCYPQGNWRTIMSYNNNCGNRLQFWSNPNVLFNNVQMGTQQRHDNARVLNETENLVREFRITPSVYYFPNEIVQEFIIADFLAHSVLSNGLVFMALPNSNVTFRAGDEIILSEGFHATSGSNFHAYIENCGNNNLNKIDLLKNGLIEENEAKIISNNAFSILPNPFTEDTRISISLSNTDKISLSVYDLLGNRIAVLADMTELSAGTHNFTFSGHNINSGVYYVVMSSSTERITCPLMLIK